MNSEQLAAIARARYKRAAPGSPEWGTAITVTAALNGSQMPDGARQLLHWYDEPLRGAALALLRELEQETRP